MTLSVGINGFGRIGRLACRVAVDTEAFNIVRINDPAGGADVMAHLLEFDSIHGRWPRRISATEASLCIDEREIAYSSTSQPADVDLRGVDLLIESSGRFRTRESLLPCLEQGVRKVVVSAPIKGPDAVNIVVGVNENRYDATRHDVLSAASCTTNCLAPVVKVLHEGLGIERGTMTTIHDLTNTQTLIDAPHDDWRRARASALSLIPTSTGSAKAIGTIFPELEGKLDGLAVRVPLMNASLTDCVFSVSRDTDAAEVNAMLESAAAGVLEGILGFETRPLVSIDYRGDARSSVVDAGSTRVIDGRLVKVLAWYDNEWGYANRLVELASLVGRAL